MASYLFLRQRLASALAASASSPRPTPGSLRG
jgi:hypothetical protein